MKKEEIPQDHSALEKLTKEVSYALDDKGNYITSLSTGWEVKAGALDVAWSDIEKRMMEAKRKVHNNEASPLLYFIELKLMDLSIVSAYTGFWKWQIKRHMRPAVFNRLSDHKIQKYAALFEVSTDELKNFK